MRLHLCRYSSTLRATCITLGAFLEARTSGRLSDCGSGQRSRHVYTSGLVSAAFAVPVSGCSLHARGMSSGCRPRRSRGETSVWPCACNTRKSGSMLSGGRNAATSPR